MDKLVSVLIPAYNHEKYVQETIKSIINQTYQNIELFVLDDGSKDNTWQKIQEMKDECEKRFVRVVFDTHENKGITYNINSFLSQASGDFVFMIASDDIAKPDLIKTGVEFLLNNHSYAMTTCNNEYIDENGKVCFWDKDRNPVYDEKLAEYHTFAEFAQQSSKVNFNSEDFGTYHTLFGQNYIPNGWVIRKEVFDKIGEYPLNVLEDWWFLLQVSKYYKIKFLDKILFQYRSHSDNSVKKSDRMRFAEKNTINIEKNILNNLNEEEVFPEVIDVKNNGICYKKQGIPFIFQILSYRKLDMKIRKIKLFNITIYEYSKYFLK